MQRLAARVNSAGGAIAARHPGLQGGAAPDAGRARFGATKREGLPDALAAFRAGGGAETEGIEISACGQDGETQTVIVKEEAAFFAMAAFSADVVSDVTSEGVLLQIESAVFKDGNKWRFSDGSNSFFAEISDKAFRARIDSGDERFGKGDVLIVDLRRVQSITDTGLKSEYIIDRVREHKAPLQMGLPLPRGDGRGQ